MHTIGQSSLRTFCPETKKIKAIKCSSVRRGNAIHVSSYLELAKRVAQLQYENREHVLMFRGQPDDYRNLQKNTTIKPNIFRPRGKRLGALEVGLKFQFLQRAEEILVNAYRNSRLPRASEIQRRKVLRWAIIQHYEICDTPLLDVTQSLRVAASFASDSDADQGYLMVLGIPNISGAITTSIDSELQVVRLASVCPPQALRPHIQEGFLLGEYPDIGGFEQKMLYRDYEVDFGRRLIAKFVFNKDQFWDGVDFPQILHGALYPDADDEFFKLTNKVASELEEYVESAFGGEQL